MHTVSVWRDESTRGHARSEPHHTLSGLLREARDERKAATKLQKDVFYLATVPAHN